MSTTDPVFLTSDKINCPHGFFTTKGGVSSGIYTSLNCGWGSEDKLENVMTNRALVLQALGDGVSDLLTAFQVHSARVATVDKIWTRERAPEVDAMVTKQPGLALGILTADCAPVFFADTKAGVIGAAHAGWKGALGGILENTVAAMVALGAARDNITAAVGPCIHQPSYEVDSGFRATFLEADPTNERFFAAGAKEGHYQFDLPSFVLDRLEACAIAGATPSAVDTYTDADHFFSYRRKTHRGEPDYGRQISVIALPA